MRNLTEDNVMQAALDKIGDGTDPRFRTLMESLITHLHGFIRDTQLTEPEWAQAMDILHELGKREEFIIMSDLLGATIHMDAIAHRKPSGATESSVLGPFYREGAKAFSQPADIRGETRGDETLVSGRVSTPEGDPISGAILDIWQTAPNGLYENLDPDQPDMNLRGRIETGKEGEYAFRTVKPVSYPIPDDGPCGMMLNATGRHNMRPAHIHFIVSADGYVPVTTQVFVEGDPYLDSDAVFGVKNSLVADFVRHDESADINGHSMPAPHFRLNYDFGLVPG